MKRLLLLLVALAIAVAGAMAQAPTNSIIIDPASFRPIQTDALTGIAIDPIGLDRSKRPCARLKIRVNRMTREEVGELSIRFRGGTIERMKQQVAYEGNGIILEMTANPNTRFYLHHDRFGDSNEVTIATEGNKEYWLEVSLNQFYSVIIASNTADAEVYIDDVLQGRTGKDFVLTIPEVLPGEHRLKVAYGASECEQTINVNSASVYFKQEVNIASSQPQYAVFQVEPKSAVVMVDNTLLPVEDGVASKYLKAGHYQYVVSAPEYYAERGEFTIAGSKVVKSVRLRPAFGTLHIVGTQSDGATLIIDGKVVGTLPLSQSPRLSSGVHSVNVVKNKYKPYATTVTISDGQQAVVTPVMQNNFARITFTVDGGAEIWIDNVKYGNGSCQCDLELGTHRVETRKEGCRAWSRTLDVTSTTLTQMTLTSPQPICGTLNVSSSPLMASVFLDGLKVGETPVVLNDVVIGKHNVEITKNGYAPHKQSVVVAEGQTATVNATLLKQAVQNTPTIQTIPIVQTAPTYSSSVGVSDFCEMVYVEGGIFEMGNPLTSASDWEKPVHTVALSDYYIGKYEVTQAQWEAVMGTNPSFFRGDNLPVESVSRNDVNEFLMRLYEQTGVKYRLPTEAEWEYAARGGNKEKTFHSYSGANSSLTSEIKEVAWFDNNSNNTTHPVGQKRPNALGLYDMSGNVAEWCEDRYTSYNDKLELNPLAIDRKSEGLDFVVRGGDYLHNFFVCTVTARQHRKLSAKGREYLGLRLVRDANTPQQNAKLGYLLGDYYSKGALSKRDYVTAVKWYTAAANKGHAEAQYELANSYRLGSGVVQNATEAANWYRKAAEQGHKQAQTVLGLCYELGDGVKRDYTEAAKWYSKAAEQGENLRACIDRVALKASGQPLVETPFCDMVFVEGGTFAMGRTREQIQNKKTKGDLPVHNVTLWSFYIGKYEVTQSQWQKVMGADRNINYYTSNPRGVGPDYPMNFITWEEAQEFILRLRLMTGKKYRLPTEAEWEYAARGANKGRSYRYSGSNNIDKVAWYEKNANGVNPVGRKSPNALGIYDMTGNVYEYCQDIYTPYTESSQVNPLALGDAERLKECYRVVRGCSWDSYAEHSNISKRFGYAQDSRSKYGYYGFRLALDE